MRFRGFGMLHLEIIHVEINFLNQ